MADTTALKNRIRAAIKANDNQEITGPVLQQTLLDIVDELDLYPELQESINTEKEARQTADIQLNELITGVKNNIDNGYVYAGIATPSVTPVSGKVFYVAIQAGTYTDFGNTAVTQGINILKYNGSVWSKDVVIGIDDEPTAGSANLVKSGEVDKLIQEKTQNYTEGKAINTNGVINDSSDTILSDYIDVLSLRGKYCTWFCNGMNNSDKALCFFDSNKDYLSSKGSTSAIQRSFDIPLTASYIVATFKKNSGNNKIIIEGNVVWQEDNITSIEKIEKNIDRTQYDAAVLNYIPDGCLTEGGTTFYKTDWRVNSDFVDVRERKSNNLIWIYGTQLNDAKLIMYGADKSTIINFSSASYASGQRQITLGSNVCYIKASYAANAANAGLKIDDEYIYQPYFGTKQYVDKSVKAATNLQNYTVGYRVEQDGSIVQDVNAIVSGKIEIGAQRIMWWHGQGSNLYLVAFDANNVVLNFWSGYSSYYRAITLPANTSYIIASFTKDASYPKMITRGSMYDVVWEASENCNVVEAAENQNSINEEDTFNPIVPSYYKAHLQSKIDAINQRDASCGNSQDSFVFITDTHIEVNYLHSPALVEKIIKGTSVKKVFHGGDVFDGQATKELGIGLYKKFMSLFPFCNPLITIGNHDLNIADRMTANELYGTCIKPIEHLVITNKKNYYYLDNENQKIRYFFMDMHTPSENYPREGEVNFTEQLNWLNDKALEVGSNWSIIVITHILFVTPTIEGGVIVGATKSDLGERLIAKLDTMYDNASMPTIIGVICGHTHWDWSEYSAKGYPIIATTTDSSYGINAQGGDVAWDTPNRTPMTISEQAFDVVHIDTANKKIYMERVGYGSNREFSY